MNRFFVSKSLYNKRLGECRKCEHYFKYTGNCKLCGCFMKVKCSMAFMECPIGKWNKTNDVDNPSDIPKHLIKEVLTIYPSLANGKAKDIETKKKVVDLYNTIFNTNYKQTTNCSSCLNSIYNGLGKIYTKYKK